MAVGFRDYYDVLGVPRDADADEIRGAYRKSARANHPDVNKDPAAEDRFKEVSEAYEVLRDPAKRAQYDRLGSNWRAGEDVSGEAGFSDTDFGESGDYSDFFTNLFGSRGARYGGGEGYSFPRRGADYEAVLDLKLADLVSGKPHHLSFGDGRDYDVDVPPGVRDGTRIRIAGEGGAGTDGGPPGDLFLRVRVADDPRFTVEDADLTVDVPITPSEAALGAEVPVPTLTGKVRVKVPAGSSSGKRLRLRGKGLPDVDGRGNLYARLVIKVPDKLTDTERDLYEKLAAATNFDPREGK